MTSDVGLDVASNGLQKRTVKKVDAPTQQMKAVIKATVKSAKSVTQTGQKATQPVKPVQVKPSPQKHPQAPGISGLFLVVNLGHLVDITGTRNVAKASCIRSA